jgi:hypothetical protein
MALALYVRFALIATELMRRNELSRSATTDSCTAANRTLFDHFVGAGPITPPQPQTLRRLSLEDTNVGVSKIHERW